VERAGRRDGRARRRARPGGRRGGRGDDDGRAAIASGSRSAAIRSSSTRAGCSSTQAPRRSPRCSAARTGRPTRTRAR
jgi:hypothetical protein